MPEECIIIADDHPLFRDAISSLVKRRIPRADVHGVGTYEAAIELARAQPNQPNMFILDLFFARKNMQDALENFRIEFKQSSIVVVSMIDDRATIQSIISCGVNGFINKSMPSQEIVEAIMAVRDGEIIIRCPETEQYSNESAIRLTDRQFAVLNLIALGKSNKEIAKTLSISPFTVQIHVSAMLRALGVSSRAAAVRKGINEGLISIGA